MDIKLLKKREIFLALALIAAEIFSTKCNSFEK